jgi:putative addiction module component (TIGR02574 family)
VDLAPLIEQLVQLPVEERIELIQALWDSIAEDKMPHELSEADKKSLDTRIAALDANPGNVVTWDHIKAQVR